jgi:molybdate transport system substrate-binding protein
MSIATNKTNEFRVMSSGAFGPAYLTLVPQLQGLTGKTIVTASTSLGSGENTLEKRLQRGEVVDIVIVADALLRQLIDRGLVVAAGSKPLARSTIGMAVRAGAPKPDISTVDALRNTLLQAKSIGYSASVSGQYLTTQLLQSLGIADQVLGKCHVVVGGVGVVVARGELEIGFQQMSELLPVPGIAHITPLPPAVQIVSVFSAGVAASCPDAAMARAVIEFLAGPQAAAAIVKSGLEPAGG